MHVTQLAQPSRLNEAAEPVTVVSVLVCGSSSYVVKAYSLVSFPERSKLKLEPESVCEFRVSSLRLDT